MAIEQIQKGIDHLTTLLEHRKRYFRIISGALAVSVLLNVLLLLGLGNINDATDASTCRADARVTYDTLRDRRDNLFSDGLVALFLDDLEEQKRIQEALPKVRAQIRDLGPLRQVYRQAGC